MCAADIIKSIKGIDSDEMYYILEQYETGKIIVLSEDDFDEMSNENNDASYLEYAEQLQGKHDYLVNNVVTNEFWFVSV